MHAESNPSPTITIFTRQTTLTSEVPRSACNTCVSRLSLATLPQRKGSSLVIVACMACVVGVLLSVLSVTVGLLRTYEVAGSPERAIVFSRDALSFGGRMEEGSTIPPDAIATLVGAPGVARDADGEPMIDAEVLAMLPPAEGFASGSLFVRGVGARGLAMRPEFKLISGRLFRPGLHEMIIGTGVERGFDLKVGDRIIMPDGEWPIVGEFSTGGGINESELLSDVATVMSTLRRTNVSSVLVGLENPGAFDAFESWLTSNPALTLTAERQSDYYQRVAWSSSAFFTAVAYLSGAVMAIGIRANRRACCRRRRATQESQLSRLRGPGRSVEPGTTFGHPERKRIAALQVGSLDVLPVDLHARVGLHRERQRGYGVFVVAGEVRGHFIALHLGYVRVEEGPLHSVLEDDLSACSAGLRVFAEKLLAEDNVLDTLSRNFPIPRLSRYHASWVEVEDPWMDKSSASLMSGVPELMILHLLARNEMYGYQLARTIRTLTTEAISVGESVLYPALHSLEKRGLVRGRRRAVEGRTRVYYSITRKGSRRLATLTSHWQRIAEGVEAVLQGARHA